MRLRSFVLWVVLLGFLVWAGYTIVVASSMYLEASGLVDRAVADALQRRKTQRGAGMSQEASRDFVANVRASVWIGAKRQGLALKPEGASVSEVGETVRVTVEWPFPVKIYDDHTLFNLPMSLTRVYSGN